MSGIHDDDRYAELLMKAVDDLLTGDEAREWEAVLAERPGASRELAEMRAIKHVTDGLADRIRADAEVEPPRETPGTKGLFLVAFALMLFGAIALIGMAGYEFLRDPTVSVWVKAAATASAAGVLLLLGYVLRVRLRGLRRDPYRHIDL